MLNMIYPRLLQLSYPCRSYLNRTTSMCTIKTPKTSPYLFKGDYSIEKICQNLIMNIVHILIRNKNSLFTYIDLFRSILETPPPKKVGLD